MGQLLDDEFRDGPAEGEVGDRDPEHEAEGAADELDLAQLHAGDAEDRPEHATHQGPDEKPADRRDQEEDEPSFEVFGGRLGLGHGRWAIGDGREGLAGEDFAPLAAKVVWMSGA